MTLIRLGRHRAAAAAGPGRTRRRKLNGHGGPRGTVTRADSERRLETALAQGFTIMVAAVTVTVNRTELQFLRVAGQPPRGRLVTVNPHSELESESFGVGLSSSVPVT